MPRVNTPAARLCRALTLRGHECRPAEIVKLMREHGHTVSRQLAARWLSSGTKYMKPVHLWALADALDISARWLAAIDDKTAMLKPLNLSAHEVARRADCAPPRREAPHRVASHGRRPRRPITASGSVRFRTKPATNEVVMRRDLWSNPDTTPTE